MLGNTGDVAFAHALHEGADLGGAYGVGAPGTLGFFHEGVLAAAVLGGVEYGSEVQVDADVI